MEAGEAMKTNVYRLLRLARGKNGFQYKRIELIARGTGTVLYVSKPCETQDEADALASKYVARRPNLVEL